MKKFVYVLLLSGLILPACSEEVTTLQTKPEPTTLSRESKFYSMPNDTRFQYDLPNFRGKNSSSTAQSSSDEEITLDPSTVKPVKKVIKTLNTTNGAKTQYQPADMPMNYNSFPKFYDANDMLQNQPTMMPMF